MANLNIDNLTKPEFKNLVDQISEKGRFGDTELAHVTKEEKTLLQALGGSGTTNPDTGLDEYFILSSLAATLLPGIAGSLFGAGTSSALGAYAVPLLMGSIFGGAGHRAAGGKDAWKNPFGAYWTQQYKPSEHSKGANLDFTDWDTVRDLTQGKGKFAGKHIGRMLQDALVKRSGISGEQHGKVWESFKNPEALKMNVDKLLSEKMNPFIQKNMAEKLKASSDLSTKLMAGKQTADASDVNIGRGDLWATGAGQAGGIEDASQRRLASGQQEAQTDVLQDFISSLA